MSENAHSPASPSTDRLIRFLLPDAGVRGVCVRLDASWQEIRRRGYDPPAVAQLLGEATAAAALFTGHAKVDGRLSVQLRGTGELRALFTECTGAGTLRAIARLREGGDGHVSRDLRELGDDALLAVTIENPPLGNTHEPSRYQGLVPIETASLAGAFESYFERSEQLPTRLALDADDTRCAGLMLQKLPGDAGDDDGWNRASMLFDTLDARELFLPPDALLQRLFAHEGLHVLGERALRFGCSCSRERVAAMLQSLGETEATEALVDGRVQVRCEFCGQAYRFSPDQLHALFTRQGVQSPAPERLQ